MQGKHYGPAGVPRLAHTGELGKRRSCPNDLRDPEESGRKVGMPAICSSVEDFHGFRSHGLGRSPTDNPNEFESYGPELWWVERFSDGQTGVEAQVVLMDSRTTASPIGTTGGLNPPSEICSAIRE